MMDPDPSPDSEPECITVPVPLRQKVTFSAVPETLERIELPEREEEKTEVSPDFQPETVLPL
jgi:hypothetical protein